jgi:stage IV sporulation protein B
MRKLKSGKLLCFILIIYSLVGCLNIRIFAQEQIEEMLPALSENVEVGSRFWELFFGENKEKDVSLLPGGGVFGVKIKQEYPTVVDAKGVPALKVGDVILSVGGKRVKTAEDVRKIVKASGGNSLTIRALHHGSEIAVEIRPSLQGDEYKIGISLRDGAAGLGTVTFIDPETGLFGGLGHGICDSESGEIISMESGKVCGVILGGIHKGESGKPGELCGILTDQIIGDLTVNCDCGVFGIITDRSAFSGQTIKIGRREEVTEGEATIITTLKNGKTAEYKIEIYDIDKSSDGSKSFRIRVTDETLKALTGGIVRGMSGSPIIQNGKLIGAVTHVLVADPTEGYGIFIENMLNSAERPMAKAS